MSRFQARSFLSFAALAAIAGATTSYSPPASAQSCIQVPVSCRVTSAFGGRYNPITKNYSTEFHHGVDFGCPLGSTVSAAETGVVTVSGLSQSAGNWVVVRSAGASPVIYKYMHHERNMATVGSVVSKGQQIALSGNTGRSTGPHLHFQVEAGGKAVDPMSNFCSKPPLKDGVLQGDSTDISQSEQPNAPSAGDGSAPAMGMDGSLDEILGDVVASRALNPDYARQLASLPTERLYAELAYIQGVRLKVQRERLLRRERIEATQAMIQILLADATLKPGLAAQRKQAANAAASSGR